MLNLSICIKPCVSALGQPLWKRLPASDWVDPSHTIGEANGSAMVVMFVDCCVGGGRYFLYYFYCRKPMGKEFFIPAGTL